MKKNLLIFCLFLISLNSVGQNVGIGTATPVEKLEVGGNIKSNGNMKANDFQFNSPKTYYYSLSGADFVSKTSTDEIYRENITAGGAFFVSSSTGMTAPVHLPHGATVTKMTVQFLDHGIAVNLQVNLRFNTGVNYLSSITTSGAPGEGSLYDNTISNAVINNSLRAYLVDAIPVGGDWPGANMIIRRVIIEYQLSQL